MHIGDEAPAPSGTIRAVKAYDFEKYHPKTTIAGFSEQPLLMRSKWYTMQFETGSYLLSHCERNGQELSQKEIQLKPEEKK